MFDLGALGRDLGVHALAERVECIGELDAEPVREPVRDASELVRSLLVHCGLHVIFFEDRTTRV